MRRIAFIAALCLGLGACSGGSRSRDYDRDDGRYDRDRDRRPASAYEAYRAPPPPADREYHSPPPPPGAFDYDYEPDYQPQRWQAIGMPRRIESRRPQAERVTAGLPMSRFRQVRFTANQGSVLIHDIDIVMDNGRVWSPRVRCDLSMGKRTQVIDLPGTVRGIREIRYVCSAPNPRERPALSIFAR